MNYDQLLRTAAQLYIRRNRNPGMSYDVLEHRLNALIDPSDKQKIYDPYQIIPKIQQDLSKRVAASRQLYELRQEKQHQQRLQQARKQQHQERAKAYEAKVNAAQALHKTEELFRLAAVHKGQELFMLAEKLRDEARGEYKLASDSYQKLLNKFYEPGHILYDDNFAPRTMGLTDQCGLCGKIFFNYGDYEQHAKKCTGKSQQDKQKKRNVLKQIQQKVPFRLDL